MTTDQIIARYKSRGGYRLADFAEVALPIYSLNVQALTLAHKRLPPIEEFILKCLALNITSIEGIREFLGLEDEVIKSALVTLAQTESIALTAPRGRQAWALTGKGRATLDTAELVSPEERTFSLHFDIITRKPILYRFQKPFKHKEALEEGLKEIELGPRKHPQTNEISPSAIEKILKATPGLTDQRRDILAVRSLSNIKPFYIRALVLVYRGNDADDVQIAFVIDGKLSEEHELAFARSEELYKLAKSLSLDPVEKQEIEIVLASLGPAPKEAEELRQFTDTAEAQVAEAVQLLESAETQADREVLCQKLQSAESELKRLKEEAKKVQIRNLYVADHPPLLEDALTSAKSRVMIISPWIKRQIVNETFIRRLERLLAAGVCVYIGYGISEQPTENPLPQDAAAVAELQAVAAKYPDFCLRRLGNTHAKVLIKDSEFAAITSFNWLSFKGDPRRTFRDEQGTLLQGSHLVNQKFTELEPRFTSSDVA